MIIVMIVTDNIKENELIAACIIGGFEHSICVITSTDKDESEQLIRTQKHDVDIFILKVRMKSISGCRSVKCYSAVEVLDVKIHLHRLEAYRLVERL